MTDQDKIIELEGRLAATELLVRALLVSHFDGKPKSELEREREELLTTLDRIQRPKSSEQDRVLNVAAQAINLAFRAVADRFRAASR